MRGRGADVLRVSFQGAGEVAFRFHDRPAFEVLQSAQRVKVPANRSEEHRLVHVRGPELAFDVNDAAVHGRCGSQFRKHRAEVCGPHVRQRDRLHFGQLLAKAIERDLGRPVLTGRGSLAEIEPVVRRKRVAPRGAVLHAAGKREEIQGEGSFGEAVQERAGIRESPRLQ